jgi:hypothetical protein
LGYLEIGPARVVTAQIFSKRAGKYLVKFRVKVVFSPVYQGISQ